LTEPERRALEARVRTLEARAAVFVSALDQETLSPLKETLKARMRARLAHVLVRIPSVDGEALAALYREGEVMERLDEGTTVEVRARIPAELRGRLEARSGVQIQEVA